MSDVTDLPVAALEVDPTNPRVDVGDVTELAASIATEGLLAPLLVRALAEGRYGVLAGSRRLAAIRTLPAMSTVPCIIRTSTTDADARLAGVADNVARADMNPIEEARAYRDLLAELEIGQSALARRVGVSQARVAKRLKLLELPDDVQGLIASGAMSIVAGYKLAKKTRGALEQARKPRHAITSDDVGMLAPVVLSDGLVVRAGAAARERREQLSDLVARAVRRELSVPSCRRCETRPALTGIGTGTTCGACR